MSDSPKFDASGKLLAEARGGDNAQPLSVSEISGTLKRIVEDRFGYVRVRGELSGYKRAASGHVYFGLKDEKSFLDGVMWKGNAARLAFAAEDGLEIIATGKLTTYPGRSKYQIVADTMELAGEGALMALFEKMKARLTQEGLFDPARKRPIPHIPKRIGIVTSPTGAVIRDILHRLNDRFPSHVIVWPVNVQGDGAKEKIAGAINSFSKMAADDPKRPDLVIVARGGGSIEDLWAFNEEPVVRAVAECSIPVISAVGHETDTTLCDYAADLRAPTPTAAAEMAVPVRAELLDRLGQNSLRINRAAGRSISHMEERLEAQRRLMPKLTELTAPHQQRCDEYSERLMRGLERRVENARLHLAGPASALRPNLLQKLLTNGQGQLNSISRLMKNLHPDVPLERGFARVTDHDGRTLTSSSAAKKAGRFNLHFADGMLGAAAAGNADDNAQSKVPKQQGATSNIGVKKSKPKKAKSPADDQQQNLFD